MKLNKKRIKLTSHAKMQVVDMSRNLRGTLRATYTQRIRKYERQCYSKRNLRRITRGTKVRSYER